MNYYIADTHFGHKNIIKLCKRPFPSLEEMDKALIEAWNKRIRPEDDVYILGDFAYKNKASFTYYLEQLQGHKHLIIGNHDKALLSNKTALAYFTSLHAMFELRDSELNVNVTLCHYPLAEWPGYYKGAYHIYGHLHNVKNATFRLMKQIPRALNASAEVVAYKPLTLAELIDCNRQWLAADETEQLSIQNDA